VSRHYRDRNDETPSHTGGVSDEYLKKAKGRREHDRGVYASSKDQDRRELYESGKRTVSSLSVLSDFSIL
jgi:pre-mRNA-splicing factor ATP-dependent RNA helicase DHX38/PRP16